MSKESKCPSSGANNKKPFYKKLWFFVIIIIVAIVAISMISKNQKEKFSWDEVKLCNRLPEPTSNVGTIISNNSDGLSIYVDKTSADDYEKYIEECKSKGYTIDSERDSDKYSAFDKEGYGLSLNYISETMYIDLEAPTEMETLTWPKSEAASLLPRPKSTVGKVSSDSANECFIYVGQTSMDDYNAYIEKCTERGFTVDYNKGDKFYYADDAEGNHLALNYEGNQVMTIQIRKSDDSTKETTSEKKTEQKSSETGLRPKFKKAMDSYEEFVNEYCDFMKKYKKSDGTDPNLLAEYSDYESKYTDIVKDFEEWDSKKMNTEEAAYYLDVQNRVNKKLLKVVE